MKRILALAALGTISAAQYQNGTIFYNSALDCTSCIRGGFDFCMNFGKQTPESTNIVLQSKECQLVHRGPQTNFTKPGTWDQEGYVCSRYFKD